MELILSWAMISILSIASRYSADAFLLSGNNIGRHRPCTRVPLPASRAFYRPYYSTTQNDDSATDSSAESSRSKTVDISSPTTEVPLYRAQGLCCVYKPRDWTSNDVVSYIRRMLERDATQRGTKPSKVGSRRNKSRIVRVGHGGTLDPLATGVLVIGVGSGTKQLQRFLDGSKRYKAGGELGFETTTLDMEGNVTKQEPFEHVTKEHLEQAIPSFVGTIEQVPPIYSAIRKDGKRLYEQARQGVSADDVEIPSRQVMIHNIDLLTCNLPTFELDVECGGGTYIRSLIRDLGYAVGSVATTTSLERTKQGPFTVEAALAKDDWSADNIYASIERFNQVALDAPELLQ